MKALMLVCDGMADRPLKALAYKTPLEAANTPNMDKLASSGITGILDPISPGTRVGSDTTHLALLGYDPYKVYTGRGPLEATGIGMKLGRSDIAFRSNFATVDKNLAVLDRRAGRISTGIAPLADAINEIDSEVEFKVSTAYRGVVIFRKKGLSSRVSDSDPHETGKKVAYVNATDGSPEAKRTASIVNEFSKKVYEKLKNHEVNIKLQREGKKPANMLLLRGCGGAVQLESFERKYRTSGACMATTGIIKGIARLSGMDVIEPEVEYESRIHQGLDALEKKDFLMLNIKEPDEAAHDHDAGKKVKIIEEIDRAIEPLIEFSKENYLLLLSDHTTSTTFGDHTGDSVPLLISGPEVRKDSVSSFGERSVAGGGLGRIKGGDLMPLLIDLMNKSEKFGA